MDPVELRIDVPFGALAAKVWGPADGKPVLALHGWLDSAASYDTLCPLLNSSLRIVALDFAGHGDSSHRPPGCHYNVLEYVIDVRRAADHLGWDQFTIIGHSMGGSVALLFAGLFPDRVLSLVLLDVALPSVVFDTTSTLTDGINKFLQLEALSKSPSPVYGMDDLMERLETASPGQLSEKSKRILLSRATRPVERGFVLKRDIRAKTSRTFTLPLEAQKAIVSRYRGDMLIFRATDGLSVKKLKDLEGVFTKLYQKHCRRFEYVELQGGHYVHLNQPELLAPVINRFLGLASVGKAKL